MKRVEIAVLGGCHIVGHPIGPAYAFPLLLSEMLGGEVVARVPHLQFVRLPEHLADIGALRPSHVVLQFGNFEILASFRYLMHQLRRAFGPPPPAKAKGAPAPAASESAAPPPVEAATVPPPVAWPAFYARVAGLGALLAVLWLYSPRYRRAFRALNGFMRQHPDTAFIVLAPFPCLDPADNALRRFGGRLLRRRLAALPNCHWLDAHQLLGADPKLFADRVHLNQQAHRALAHGLAAVVLSTGA